MPVFPTLKSASMWPDCRSVFVFMALNEKYKYAFHSLWLSNLASASFLNSSNWSVRVSSFTCNDAILSACDILSGRCRCTGKNVNKGSC
jgi:hypothetical protein